MSKTILLSYRYSEFVPFGEGEYYEIYILTLYKESFWGWKKKTFEVTSKIYPLVQNVDRFKAHWDKLIREKISIKKEKK